MVEMHLRSKMILRPLSIPRDDLDIILTKVGEDWKQLNHRRLLLTGGTGFVGKWLPSSFLHANRDLSLRARAVVVTLPEDAFASNLAPYRWVKGTSTLTIVSVIT
jgi:hypothetical protein